jgi:FkbM family methyltransferase
MINNFFNRIYIKIINLVHKYFFFKEKKKINLFLKKIYKNKISILDVGAGQRYLKSILNFDGICKVGLIDPSENLEITKKNLLNKMQDLTSLNFFKFALSNKNGYQKYYPARKSTGSSLINFKKFKSKINYDVNYFGDVKSRMIKVLNYKKFKLSYNWSKLDILKIDVEGYEKKIIKNILNIDKPLIIQIELNFTSALYEESFNFINNFLNRKNYQILSLIPSYNSFAKFNETCDKPFIYGNYENPIFRNQISQCDCFYINTKSKFTIKKIVILIGFGFFTEAYKYYLSNKNKINSQYIKNKLELFFKKYIKI